MSLARLLNQSLSVQAMGSTTTNAYGDQVPAAVGAPVAVSGYLEQASSVEYVNGRDTTVSTWKAYLPAGTAVTPLSVINFGAQSFQVDGAPWQVYNPRTRVVSHIECKLIVVEG